MAVLVFLVLFLALTGHSCATYCICKDGIADTQLQKALDYACGAGADCTQIIQSGPCYQPNTVKDHCSYAVNSYFQKKGQAVGTCDFSGTAMTSATLPQNVASGCTYPASATSSTGNSSNSGTAPTGTNTPSSIIPPPPSSVFTGLGPTGTTVANGVAPQFKGTNLGFMASSLTLLFSVPFLLWG
ncbi:PLASMODESMATA CALLOSE-BINDING PROTEIN 3-like [Populus alba x Populus x berolinensis]|nr:PLASMODESMATA CALLOSE-BINDING PROTEIN 3-like [Populus alba x Populus x berolinensis]